MKLLPFIAATMFLTACIGSAQVHYQDTNGGVLVLKGAQDKAMENAHQQMAMHCGPGNYQVVRQERVVVGSETNNHTYETQEEQRERLKNGAAHVDAESGQDRYGSYASANGRSHEREQERARGTVEGHNQTVTTDVMEFRVHYACGHGNAAAAR